MGWLNDLLSIAVDITNKVLPSATKVVVAGQSITAGQFETSVGTLSTFLAAVQAAFKGKDYPAAAELVVEEALTVATDLGIGEPYVGIAKLLFPIIFNEAENIVNTPLTAVNGGWGGLVSQAWADDPRHQLNPDGTFKN